MYKVIGKINGETESMTYHWDNGKGRVEGGPMAMFLFQSALERTSQTGPVGQWMDRDIDEPLSALFMIQECFEEILSYEGDLPEAEELPEGAIG